jgi:hypothetical protein
VGIWRLLTMVSRRSERDCDGGAREKRRRRVESATRSVDESGIWMEVERKGGLRVWVQWVGFWAGLPMYYASWCFIAFAEKFVSN